MRIIFFLVSFVNADTDTALLSEYAHSWHEASDINCAFEYMPLTFYFNAETIPLGYFWFKTFKFTNIFLCPK